MTTIGFKKSSGDDTRNFNAVYIAPFYPRDEERFVDANYARRKTIRAAWHAWEIRFGKLTLIQLQFLEELVREEAPQMILDSTTYDIDLDSVKTNFKGTKIVVINTEPES
jgi:hypothetical protein